MREEEKQNTRAHVYVIRYGYVYTKKKKKVEKKKEDSRCT